MIPLLWLLLAWLILMGMFALVTLLTVVMNLRYGLSSFGTYVSTAVFLSVIALVLLGTGAYLFTVDWSQTLNLFGGRTSEIEF
jgi:hypothetical protein